MCKSNQKLRLKLKKSPNIKGLERISINSDINNIFFKDARIKVSRYNTAVYMEGERGGRMQFCTFYHLDICSLLHYEVIVTLLGSTALTAGVHMHTLHCGRTKNATFKTDRSTFNVRLHFSSWSWTTTRKATDIMKRLKQKQTSQSCPMARPHTSRTTS